jgi:hypothetical protein
MIYYRGKDVEDMTREELVDALVDVSKLYDNLLENALHEAKVLERIKNAKRETPW